MTRPVRGPRTGPPPAQISQALVKETDEELSTRVAAELGRSLKIAALVAGLATALGLWWR